MVSCISGAYQSKHVKHDQILNILQAMYIFSLHFCWNFEPQNKDLANVGHKIKGIIPVSNIKS